MSGISVNRRGNKVDLYLARYGRWLGEVVGGIFYTRREFKHYFLKYQGFGFNRELILHLREHRVDYIRVLYTTSRGDRTSEAARLLDVTRRHALNILRARGYTERMVCTGRGRWAEWERKP